MTAQRTNPFIAVAQRVFRTTVGATASVHGFAHSEQSAEEQQAQLQGLNPGLVKLSTLQDLIAGDQLLCLAYSANEQQVDLFLLSQVVTPTDISSAYEILEGIVPAANIGFAFARGLVDSPVGWNLQTQDAWLEEDEKTLVLQATFVKIQKPHASDR